MEFSVLKMLEVEGPAVSVLCVIVSVRHYIRVCMVITIFGYNLTDIYYSYIIILTKLKKKRLFNNMSQLGDFKIWQPYLSININKLRNWIINFLSRTVIFLLSNN